MTFDNVVALIVSLALVAYLVAALVTLVAPAACQQAEGRQHFTDDVAVDRLQHFPAPAFSIALREH